MEMQMKNMRQEFDAAQLISSLFVEKELDYQQRIKDLEF